MFKVIKPVTSIGKGHGRRCTLAFIG